jgi:hypothetical protein
VREGFVLAFERIDDRARLLPLINPALFRAARFPRIGLVDARPVFFIPLAEEFSTEFPAFKVGGQWRVRESQLTKWIQALDEL